MSLYLRGPYCILEDLTQGLGPQATYTPIPAALVVSRS